MPLDQRHEFDEFDPFAESTPALTADEELADPYAVVLERLRLAVSNQFTPPQLEKPAQQTMDWIRAKGRELLQEYNDLALTEARVQVPGDLSVILQRMLNELLGLGEIEELLKIGDVEDIAMNGPEDVWIKRKGAWENANVTFSSAQGLLTLLNRAIVHTGRQAGPGMPIVDAHLRAGHRISIVTDPLADPWPVVVIRKHSAVQATGFDLVSKGGGQPEPVKAQPIPDYFEHATSEGVFTPLAMTFLHMAIVAGMNILVVGATGVGKTFTMNALGNMIPADRRILVIEDTRELNMRARENGIARNCVYFTTRPESIEGAQAIGQDALVRAALRQRPDALTVGEARGAEVFDLLKAMWTGHGNGLTSIHAESLTEVADRIRMMLQETAFTTQVGEETIAMWIAKAFHLGITLRMTETGRRYVHEIVEFTGVVEGRMPALNRLFVPDTGDARLRLAAGRLHHEAMFQQAGYTFDVIRQTAQEQGTLAS